MAGTLAPMTLGPLATQLFAAVLSLGAAFIFAFGLALQQKGNLDAMEAELAGTVRRSGVLVTVTRPAWIAGILLGGLVGFAIFAVALRLGSLVLVETVQVTQMIFTVPLSAWVARTSVRRREWEAACVLVAGLGVLLVAVAPTPGNNVGVPLAWGRAIPIVVLVAAVLALAAWRAPAYAAALLGAATGALFGLQSAVVKEVTALLVNDFTLRGLLWSWSPWVAGGLTISAVVLQNLALRAGRLSAAQITMTTAAPVVSAIIGVAVFGEVLSLDPWRFASALAGAVACAWAIAHLARSPSLLAVAGDLIPADS